MGPNALRALRMAVVVMGVLIVAGVGVLIAALVNRMSSAPGRIASGGGTGAAAPAPTVPGAVASTVLDEPAGTRIVGIQAAGDRLVLHLGGAGPDRVLVLDARTGRVLARVELAR